MRRFLKISLAAFLLYSCVTAAAGFFIGAGVLHPMNLNPPRQVETAQMIERTGALKEEFNVRAPDGIELRGWKIRSTSRNGDWVLLMHGISDNRTGVLGPAEFLLRHGYNVVMMDSRAHGESGGSMATYGWKERHDTVAIDDALYSTEKVRHLYALGVSMGGSIALQTAAIDPRIERVVAEDPFANLREVSYDYAGLELSPLLGKTIFRPVTIIALHQAEKEGGFIAEDVSPEEAVAERPFPVLLICGTRDHRIPCRHAEWIYEAAQGPKELWIVNGAKHASALGQAPAEYERRVFEFFGAAPAASPTLPLTGHGQNQ
jgi:hypothetical protein